MNGMEGKEVFLSGEGFHSDGAMAVLHSDEDIDGKAGLHSDEGIKGNSGFYSDIGMEGRAGFHSLPKEMVLRVLSLLSLDQLRACAEVAAGGNGTVV